VRFSTNGTSCFCGSQAEEKHIQPASQAAEEVLSTRERRRFRTIYLSHALHVPLLCRADWSLQRGCQDQKHWLTALPFDAHQEAHSSRGCSSRPASSPPSEYYGSCHTTLRRKYNHNYPRPDFKAGQLILSQPSDPDVIVYGNSFSPPGAGTVTFSTHRYTRGIHPLASHNLQHHPASHHEDLVTAFSFRVPHPTARCPRRQKRAQRPGPRIICLLRLTRFDPYEPACSKPTAGDGQCAAPSLPLQSASRIQFVQNLHLAPSSPRWFSPAGRKRDGQ
jgi:hypothetical protein